MTLGVWVMHRWSVSRKLAGLNAVALRVMLLLVVFMSFLAIKVVPCFLDKARMTCCPKFDRPSCDR